MIASLCQEGGSKQGWHFPRIPPHLIRMGCVPGCQFDRFCQFGGISTSKNRIDKNCQIDKICQFQLRIDSFINPSPILCWISRITTQQNRSIWQILSIFGIVKLPFNISGGRIVSKYTPWFVHQFVGIRIFGCSSHVHADGFMHYVVFSVMRRARYGERGAESIVRRGRCGEIGS